MHLTRLCYQFKGDRWRELLTVLSWSGIQNVLTMEETNKQAEILIITALTGVYELAYRKRVLSAGGKLWSLTHCPDPWQLKSRIHCWKKGWVLQRADSQLGTFFTLKKCVSMLVDRFGCHGWEWQGPDVTGSL